MGISYNAPGTQVQLQPSVDRLMTGLQTAIDRTKSGQADAAITRWFGADAVAQKDSIARTLSRFRSNINIKTIVVGFEALELNPNFSKVTNPVTNKVTVISPRYARSAGTNAAAYASPDANVSLDLGDVLSHAPSGDAPVFLGEGFRSLPQLLPLAGGQIDTSGWIQSQFETLVHELSHLLLGTKDIKFTDGSTAYGTQAAAELATFGSSWAFQNAENWGIYVEAAGVQKVS